MATQTETYKFNKPARTDNIDVEKLNENFDIVEAELKKRPLSSDVAATAFYDLDITAWTAVDFAKENGEAIYLSDYLDSGVLLAQIGAGRALRVKFNGVDSTPHTVVLNAVHQHTVDAGERTTCSGTASNTYYNVHSDYSLNIIDDKGEYTIWFAVRPLLTGEGMVKSVNGVTPDDDGNVDIQLPVSVSDDGYTDISGLRQATNVSIAKTGNTISVNVMLEGGQSSESVVTLDEDGYPSKIVTDGVECTVTWEGFDT